MNHYLKGRQLMHGDILSPETVVATFSEDFSIEYIKTIVATLNHGSEMLQAYKALGNSWDIDDVHKLLHTMDGIYNKWSYEKYAASRGEK